MESKNDNNMGHTEGVSGGAAGGHSKDAEKKYDKVLGELEDQHIDPNNPTEVLRETGAATSGDSSILEKGRAAVAQGETAVKKKADELLGDVQNIASNITEKVSQMNERIDDSAHGGSTKEGSNPVKLAKKCLGSDDDHDRQTCECYKEVLQDLKDQKINPNKPTKGLNNTGSEYLAECKGKSESTGLSALEKGMMSLEAGAEKISATAGGVISGLKTTVGHVLDSVGTSGDKGGNSEDAVAKAKKCLGSDDDHDRRACECYSTVMSDLERQRINPEKPTRTLNDTGSEYLQECAGKSESTGQTGLGSAMSGLSLDANQVKERASELLSEAQRKATEVLHTAGESIQRTVNASKSGDGSSTAGAILNKLDHALTTSEQKATQLLQKAVDAVERHGGVSDAPIKANLEDFIHEGDPKSSGDSTVGN